MKSLGRDMGSYYSASANRGQERMRAWDFIFQKFGNPMFYGAINSALKKKPTANLLAIQNGAYLPPQSYPFMTSDLRYLHGLDPMSASLLVPSFLLTGLLLLNPLTGKEKTHFCSLVTALIKVVETNGNKRALSVVFHPRTLPFFPLA